MPFGDWGQSFTKTFIFMKNFTFLFSLLIAAGVAFSQALPFKYQAIIRNSDGEVLVDKNVGLRVSILQDTNNMVVYTEEFNKNSDEFGIIDLEVGTGNILSGNYITIDWSKPSNQLKIEIDMNGGTTYSLLGTSPILSAPIANYALRAGSSTFPAGMIMPFAGSVDKIPEGWLLCDGSEVSRTEMASLYDVVGIAYGVGNQTTTFNLPDFRAMFLRGANLGRTDEYKDPEVNSRTPNDFGNTDDVGSKQIDAFAVHDHDIPYKLYDDSQFYTGNANRPLVSSSGTRHNVQSGQDTGNKGGSETRPNNIYINYIIKY
jgi:microcystin-dependent protein